MKDGTLAQFQDAFIDALYRGSNEGDDVQITDTRVAAMCDQPGFSVYRNTVFKGCVDALQANFPAVARLVGDAWFRAAAAVYVRSSPPTDARMVHYGATFAAFLEAFEPARELPYLANVARLDRLWTQSHTAADDTLAGPAQFAGLAPGQMEHVVLRPHAAARWIWFDAQPAYTIWRANREGVDVPEALAWQGEGALLTRPEGGVQWRALSAGGCEFMTACEKGIRLEDAAQQALGLEPEMDISSLLPNLLMAGAIAAVDIVSL